MDFRDIVNKELTKPNVNVFTSEYDDFVITDVSNEDSEHSSEKDVTVDGDSANTEGDVDANADTNVHSDVNVNPTTTTTTAKPTSSTKSTKATTSKPTVAKPKRIKLKFHAFHEFPKLNKTLQSISLFGEEYFLDFLTKLTGEKGVIRQLNLFVESILQVNKILPENFITIRFILSENTFMGIFLQLLNLKRYDNISLKPNAFNNIILIFNKIMDHISIKTDTFFAQFFTNDKEYELLQYIIILGQTFFQAPHEGIYEKDNLLMSKRLGKHSLLKKAKTWQKLIEFHIKNEKQNLKVLKQKMTKEREQTVKTTTVVTYLFNMTNFGVDEKCKEKVRTFAEKFGVSEEYLNNAEE